MGIAATHTMYLQISTLKQYLQHGNKSNARCRDIVKPTMLNVERSTSFIFATCSTSSTSHNLGNGQLQSKTHVGLNTCFPSAMYTHQVHIQLYIIYVLEHIIHSDMSRIALTQCHAVSIHIQCDLWHCRRSLGKMTMFERQIRHHSAYK